MRHYYVNRQSRWDRHHLFCGAMAGQGIPAESLHRSIAMDKDNYTSDAEICEAARVDFPEFFTFHLESPQPRIKFGHLICSWSVMRMWRAISQGSEIAGAWLDDYALRVPEVKLRRLVDDIEPDILQLAWHLRPDVFVNNVYKVPFRYDIPSTYERLGDAPVFCGAPGGSDWANILSPRGAGWLLDFMSQVPYFNSEVAIQALFLKTRRQGIYSVVASNPFENGTMVLTQNAWVLQLWPFTTGNASDLVGTHEGSC